MVKFINLNEQNSEHLTFDKSGYYLVFFHNISGSFVFDLTAPGVELDIFGLFTGGKDDNFKIETTQHHIAPSTVSNLFIKGVFNDNSKLNYQGLIRIEKEGQKSHAYQKNQNLILSSNTYVESKPFLEILANDVFCTHGSTTGKLNKDELYYLESRGLSPESAQELLVKGFVDEIVDKVKEKVPSFKFKLTN